MSRLLKIKNCVVCTYCACNETMCLVNSNDQMKCRPLPPKETWVGGFPPDPFCPLIKVEKILEIETDVIHLKNYINGLRRYFK